MIQTISHHINAFFHFAALVAGYTVIACFCLGAVFLSWCRLRDSQKARRKARAPAPAVYLSFVLPDRLTVPSEAERAILEARAKRRKKVDEDIEAITRQIEENR